MHLPPAPVWDASVDSIDMKDFTRRARDFERSWLPRGIVLPREGQVWQAIRDCQVGFLAWFSKAALAQQGVTPPSQGPLFPFEPVRLSRGEKVLILTVDDPKPLSVSFVPVRYVEGWESLMP